MKPNPIFINLPKDFWANIRMISQEVGYTIRKSNLIKVPTIDEIKSTMVKLNLDHSHIVNKDETLTEFGALINGYFNYRADALNKFVEPSLMDLEDVIPIYKRLKKEIKPKSPQPLNKQSGIKRKPAYLTCIVNMLIESNLNGLKCDFSPRELTTVTRNGAPLRTLSRWVDGAFPAPINPIAIWEIKEYYFTTTFGSRVADGVYESLLDGMELEELYEHEKIDVKHYLFIDSHYTWWDCGKGYLCRIIDMLNMGYVDEVLFGKEVIDRLPNLVHEWIQISNS